MATLLQFAGSPPPNLQERSGVVSLKDEMSELLVEYMRPWKIGSLAIGMSLLVAGSFYYEAPDWDIAISLIMALFAYLTAPWSMRVVVERQWRRLPLMLLFTWVTVDGCYWLYWRFRNPMALMLMRDANFPASLCLYAMCGLVWYFKGSLRQLIAEARLLVAGAIGR